MRISSRILAAAGALALVAIPLFGCDAGDDGGTPTGAPAQYTPGMDLTGSTLTAEAVGAATLGGEFTILAHFRDGEGRPVEGMDIWATHEERSCFFFGTNPSLTDAGGMASITVGVSGGCPEDSYTITVYTSPGTGPRTQTFVHVSVRTSTLAVVSSVDLSTSTSTVQLPGNANFTATAQHTPACDLRMEYRATGAGVAPAWTFEIPTENPWDFSVIPSSPGPLTVRVRAYCAGEGVYTYSDSVDVTVTAPAP